MLCRPIQPRALVDYSFFHRQISLTWRHQMRNPMASRCRYWRLSTTRSFGLLGRAGTARERVGDVEPQIRGAVSLCRAGSIPESCTTGRVAADSPVVLGSLQLGE
jgi:hypothetical protein